MHDSSFFFDGIKGTTYTGDFKLWTMSVFIIMNYIMGNRETKFGVSVTREMTKSVLFGV